MFYLDYAAAGDRLHLKAGRFTPAFGGFMTRQDTWDNPLANYPLLYENVLSITDLIVNTGPNHLTHRRELSDLKDKWVPLIWAPLYTRGAAVSGSWSHWEYAATVTNRAPPSRSVDWEEDFGEPSVLGRLGYRFANGLKVAGNLSYGTYLQQATQNHPNLHGTDSNDYHQWLAGVDAAYEKGPWQFWGEFWWSSFEVPNVETEAEVYSYFVEAKRSLGAKWWAALRWNQEWYNQIDTPTGPEDWGNPIVRIDAGLGWKPLRHLTLKLTYTHQAQERVDYLNARNFAVVNGTMRF